MMSDNCANEIASGDDEKNKLVFYCTSGSLAPIWVGLKNFSTQEHLVKVCVLAPLLFGVHVFETPSSVRDLSVSIFDSDASLEETMELVERLWLVAANMMRKQDKLAMALHYFGDNYDVYMFSDGSVEQLVDHFVEYCSFESELIQLLDKEQRCMLLIFYCYIVQVHRVLFMKEDRLGLCGFGCLKKDSASDLERGLAQHKQGDYEEAVKFYEIGIQKSPLSYEFYLNRAKSYLKLNKFELAIRDCQRCILLKPDEPNVYRYCANAHCGLNEVRKAINVLTSGRSSVSDIKGNGTMEAFHYILKTNEAKNLTPEDLSEIVYVFDSSGDTSDED